jgi:branched-chain amino acid transport system ATP-binding protein
LGKREVLLKLNNIETYYQDVIEAIRGVSLEVKENSIVCVLGANGAGKTTLLRTIARLLDDDQPEKGTIVFSGQRIERKKSQELVRLGISLVPEGRELFPDLTVCEHLKLGAYTRRDSQAVKEDWQKVIKYFPILEQRAGQRADTLSGGEQQMLAIGRAWKKSLASLRPSVLRAVQSCWWNKMPTWPSRLLIMDMFWRMAASFFQGAATIWRKTKT